ncbi:MAG: hypothetical protein H0X30_35395 [Anaerolineae bacterium]|nr:hypothetical protein [Anaerolineae bacterium]
MTIEIEVTPEQRQRIELLAQQLGFETSVDYVRSLIESDAKAHGQDLVLNDDDDPIEGFREGWRDAMTGNTYPVSTLWDM